MKISDVKIMGEPLILTPPREVDDLEARLWITFPAGYREYVTERGDGELGGFVTVYPPWRIEKEVAGWRDRIDKYWFWDAGNALLPKARALECFVIADSGGGDELVFHPRRPDRLFVLPHDEGKVFEAGADLLTAVDWMCGSGVLTRRIKDRGFRPRDSRDTATEERSAVDPPGESLDDIVKLGRAWVRRHGAREIVRRELPIGKGRETFVYEAIVLDANEAFGIDRENQGYLAVFRVETPDGDVRIFNCDMTDGSHGFHDGDLVRRKKSKGE